ncbi:hypothetical protein GCM10009779_68550 [Polymorphospora rubra]
MVEQRGRAEHGVQTGGAGVGRGGRVRAGQQEVGQAAEGVAVGGWAVGAVAEHLGCDVALGAGRQVGDVAAHPEQSEVDEHGLPVPVDDDVGGADVAVDDRPLRRGGLSGVQPVEYVGNLGEAGEDGRRRAGLPGRPVPQVGALDPVHHQVEGCFGGIGRTGVVHPRPLEGGVYADDARVPDQPQQVGLLDPPAAPGGPVLVGRAEHLDRDLLPLGAQRHVGLPEFRLTATADLPQQAIFVRLLRRADEEVGGAFGHGRSPEPNRLSKSPGSLPDHNGPVQG